MRKQLFFIYFLALFSFTNAVFAADLKGLSRIFKSTFWTDHYEPRYCGRNIEKLVEKALDQGLDLTGAQIVAVTDAGFNNFGMVKALQAREKGRRIDPVPSRAPFFEPGWQNWYHHVFLLVDGKVLDYDFTNRPKILTMKNYFLEMFIPADKKHDRKFKLDKMGKYKIQTYPAEDYILRLRQRLGREEISTTQYLPVYMPHFFQ